MDLEIILSRAKLTKRQNYIMQKYWIEGYTQEELAKELNIKQPVVSKHLRYIRKKLHKALKEMGEVNDKK